MTATSPRTAATKPRASAAPTSCKADTGRSTRCVHAERSGRSATALTTGRSAEQFARVGDFDIFLIAGRYTLLDQDALTSLLPLCAEKGICVVVGGPFNSGILATGVKADAHYQYGPPPEAVKERVRRIQEICKAYKVKLAEAALRFPLGHPAVVSVIPGAQRASEAKRNGEMMNAKIPPALWRTLKEEKLIRADAPAPR